MTDPVIHDPGAPGGEGEVRGRSYGDIVRAEFQKNRLSVWALRVIFGLFAAAVLAPFLVNGRPYTAVENGVRIWPLFDALNVEELVVLLAGVCALAASVLGGPVARRLNPAEPSRPRRILIGLTMVVFAVGTGLLVRFVSRQSDAKNYRELAATGGITGAIFAPVPFGYRETNPQLIDRPPALWAAYRLVKQSDLTMKTAGVPEKEIIDRLEGLRWERFASRESFDAALVAALGAEDAQRWGDHIRTAAETGGHWLGTDNGGGDVLARLIYGSRTSLAVGFVAVGISVLLGVLYGGIMGYCGGRVDFVMMRIIEIVMSIPTFFLIIIIISVAPRSLFIIMVVIGLTTWPGEARFVRAEFLRLRKQDFVTAAEALGIRPMVIMFRHMLPNGIAPVLVDATFGVGSAIFTEATLSFLGFGAGPEAPSWGAMLSEVFSDPGNWWMTTFPGAAIFVTVLCYNLVGEGLRDAVDPRLRKAAA